MPDDAPRGGHTSQPRRGGPSHRAGAHERSDRGCETEGTVARRDIAIVASSAMTATTATAAMMAAGAGALGSLEVTDSERTRANVTAPFGFNAASGPEMLDFDDALASFTSSEIFRMCQAGDFDGAGGKGGVEAPDFASEFMEAVCGGGVTTGVDDIGLAGCLVKNGGDLADPDVKVVGKAGQNGGGGELECSGASAASGQTRDDAAIATSPTGVGFPECIGMTVVDGHLSDFTFCKDFAASLPSEEDEVAAAANPVGGFGLDDFIITENARAGSGGQRILRGGGGRENDSEAHRWSLASNHLSAIKTQASGLNVMDELQANHGGEEIPILSSTMLYTPNAAPPQQQHHYLHHHHHYQQQPYGSSAMARHHSTASPYRQQHHQHHDQQHHLQTPPRAFKDGKAVHGGRSGRTGDGDDYTANLREHKRRRVNGVGMGCSGGGKGTSEKRGVRSTSKFRGVTHHCRTGRWEAHIWENGKQVYLGGFDSEEQAALAYDVVRNIFRLLSV